jgi:hypothetical protein
MQSVVVAALSLDDDSNNASLPPLNRPVRSFSLSLFLRRCPGGEQRLFSTSITANLKSIQVNNQDYGAQRRAHLTVAREDPNNYC